MALVLSTDSVEPRQRAAFWQEMVCQSFVRALCRSKIDDAFRGQIATEDWGEMQISQLQSRRNRVDRRRSDIAENDRPRYYLCYQAQGRAKYSERHTENYLDTGEMIILNNCEPYCVEYDDNVTSIVLQVPQDLLRERFQSPERCAGRKLAVENGLMRVTADFLRSCVTHAASLSRLQRELASQVALTLLTDLMVSEISGTGELGSQQTILMARIKRHILGCLHDPNLDVASVARAVKISPRYVTKLFTLEGEPMGRFLLRSRIDRAKRELGNPGHDALKVGEIGLRAGFSNVSHFSRAFRESTGLTPTEFRVEAREAIGATGQGA